jgi:hypothetical protein
MPDVIHWLGISRIDRFVSMSNMKYDALAAGGHRDWRAGADPRRFDPADASVEMEAKKAAGYYTPEGAPSDEALKKVVGRDLGSFRAHAGRCDPGAAERGGRARAGA